MSKRDRIVALRIAGKSLNQIVAETGIPKTTVRYHLWMDATDLEDRKEGFYGTNLKRQDRREKQRQRR